MKITKEIKELVRLRVSEYYEAKKDEIRKQERDEQAERGSKFQEIGNEYNALIAEHIPPLVRLIQEEIMKNHSDFVDETRLGTAIREYVGGKEIPANIESRYFAERFVKDSGRARLQEFTNAYKALNAERENAILETIISLELGGTKDDLDAVLEKFRIPEAE